MSTRQLPLLPARRARRGPRWAPVGALLAVAASLCLAAHAEKGLSDGTFKDSSGGQHAWSIGRNHLLSWEAKPYAPAGVVFRSAYLRAPSPETLRQDTEELDRLKGAGIQDLWIEPQRGLLENTPEQTQAVVDAVETRGFRYGLRIGDRSRDPLVGFAPVLAPVRVPVSRLQPGGRPSWQVQAPAARRAVYALVQSQEDDRVQNWAIASGEVVVEGEVAQIEVQLKNTRLLGTTRGLLHVVPEIQVEPEELGSFGDLWEGMESYAARAKKHLQGVKFGPGFRFILDPFSAGDGTRGQEELVFPSSQSFRTEFAEWLKRRGGIQTLNTRWRVGDKRVTSFEEAARLVPMWSRNDAPDGDGWLFDPEERVAYRCTPRQSGVWNDLDDFRADTLKRWMNRMSVSLKEGVVNVPVLFSWGAYHPVFTNTPSPSGYDGLGAHVYGSAAGIARESAAYALAQAEEADRNTWLIATRLAGPVDDAGKPAPISDAAQVRALWASLRDVGFRGAYLDPQQVPNAVPLAADLAAAVAADAAALQQKVPVVFFPMPMATADRVTRLSNGVWWIPSGAPARMLRYGDTVLGYEMVRPLGEEHPAQQATVLWSTTGKQQITFFADPASPVALFDSAGLPIKVKPKKDELKLMLTEEPIIATGLDPGAIFPLELATEQLREFDTLLRQAEALKYDTQSLRSLYRQAEDHLSLASAASLVASLQPHLANLRARLVPYQWIEGERSTTHNFSGSAFQAGASAGTYLKLDRSDPPPSGVYRARYSFEVRQPGSYEIWVAGRVPGRAGVSPLIWQVDEEPAVEATSPVVAGGDYATGMAWYQLGRLALTAGKHELTLVVPQRAGGSPRFSFGIDAIVVSRTPFRPNGTEKPSGLPTPPPAKTEKDDEREGGKKNRKKDDRGGRSEKQDPKAPKQPESRPAPAPGEDAGR